LTEQEHDIVTPVYDGFSPVEGVVTLENRERISELLVKVHISLLRMAMADWESSRVDSKLVLLALRV
jgi:hypothetical protein